MKLIVYTALFADPDIPANEVGQFFNFVHDKGDVEYIAFTNRTDFTSNFWDVRVIEVEECSPRMQSRMIKWNPEKYLSEHTHSLWLDSPCYFIADPKSLIKHILENNKYHTAIHHHGDINSLYAEGMVSAYLYKTDVPEIINRQLESYFADGHPYRYDHFETAILIRQNNKESRQMNQMVRNELQTHSIRDQICVPYIVRKLRNDYNSKIKTIMESYVAHNHSNPIPKSKYFFTVPKPTEKLKEDLTKRNGGKT